MFVQMDLRSVASTAFRQFLKFAVVFVPIVLIGILYLLLAPRQYESNSTLLIKFGQDARPEIPIDGASNPTLSAEDKRGLVQSNLNILISRDVLEELLKTITLERAYPDIAHRDLDANTKQTAALKKVRDDIATITESEAGIIQVGVYNADPVVARDMARKLIDLFLARQSDIYGNPQIDVLQEQAGKAAVKLDAATKALNDYKIQHGVTSIDQEFSMLLQQRGDLAGYLSRRSTDSSQNPVMPMSGTAQGAPAPAASPAQDGIGGALPARLPKAGDSSRFPVVEDVQKKIDDLRSQESQMLLTYRPDSDVIKSIRRNIAMENAALQKSISALNGQISDLDRQIAEKQSLRAPYDDLTRNVDLAKESFATAQSRLQAAQANNDLTQRKITRISILEEPQLPIKPAKPNKMLVLLLTLVVAATFGTAVCLAAELLDSTFSRPDQLSSTFKKPVLANFVNYATGAGGKPILSGSGTNAPRGLSENELLSLYHMIDTALPGRESKIIHFASCLSGEGAGTIAREIARIASENLGQKVLFVLPAGSEAGKIALSQVAAGRGKLSDAVREKTAGGAGFATAALSHDGRSDEVMSQLERLEGLFTELRQSYQLIVMPTPNATSSIVAASISRLSDGVVLVVEAERTRAPVVRQVLNLFTDAGANVLGLVLNKQLLYIPDWLYRRL